MKTAIILHGTCGREEYYDPNAPSPSNAHWLPWLQKRLLARDILAQTPEMPRAYAAEVYEDWRQEFERYEITPETILVGHSAGAGFLLRWLSETKCTSVGTVVLVAPWLDPDQEESADFYDFTIDPSLNDRTTQLSVFYSLDDSQAVRTSVELIKASGLLASCTEFQDKGHFTAHSLGGEAFHELLDEVLKYI